MVFNKIIPYFNVGKKTQCSTQMTQEERNHTAQKFIVEPLFKNQFKPKPNLFLIRKKLSQATQDATAVKVNVSAASPRLLDQ